MVQRKKPVIQEQVQHVPKAGPSGAAFRFWTLLTYLHFVVFGFVEAFLGLFTLQVMVQHVPVQKVVEKQASLN